MGAVAFFATYEECKNKMLMLRAKRPDEMDTPSILVAGSLAGAAYVIISHPFETVAGTVKCLKTLYFIFLARTTIITIYYYNHYHCYYHYYCHLSFEVLFFV